jgi:hypothetical protein
MGMAEKQLPPDSESHMIPPVEGQNPLDADLYTSAADMAEQRVKALSIAQDQLAADPTNLSLQQRVDVMRAEVARFEQHQPPPSR